MHGLPINFSSIFNYRRCSLKNLKFCHVHFKAVKNFFYLVISVFLSSLRRFVLYLQYLPRRPQVRISFRTCFRQTSAVERWLVKNFHVIKLLVSFSSVDDSVKKAFFEMALAIKVPHTIRLVTYFFNSALQESNWIESAAIVVFHLTDFGRIKAHL